MDLLRSVFNKLRTFKILAGVAMLLPLLLTSLAFVGVLVLLTSPELLPGTKLLATVDVSLAGGLLSTAAVQLLMLLFAGAHWWLVGTAVVGGPRWKEDREEAPIWPPAAAGRTSAFSACFVRKGSEEGGGREEEEKGEKGSASDGFRRKNGEEEGGAALRES